MHCSKNDLQEVFKMTYDTLEYLMEIHYWALFELFVFAFAVYFAKSWIDYWFAKKLKK